MSLFEDFFSLLGGCITLFAVDSRAQFGLTLLVGVALAALCWFACSRYSRLWNLRYRVTLTHHILCALAAILTLVFVVIFAALRYTREAAYVSVQVWENQINRDEAWANSTFATAWQKVKSTGREDFSSVPSPGKPDSIIPMTNPASIRLAAAIFAQASVEYFNNSRPFLSKILQAHTEVPSNVLDADVHNYFAAGNRTYPQDKAVSLVAKQIESQLDEQLPRVVTTFRLIAVALFLCVQFVPFGLVGVAAYKNLKVAT